jgi:hypothetical protein
MSGSRLFSVRLTCVAFLLFAGVDIRAQSDPAMAAQALYPLPRDREDWSRLRDPAVRTDIWDPLKFIPLGGGAPFLSLGGEIRDVYERFGNQNFGLSAPDPGGYFLQRGLFHADLRLGAHLRVWSELSSSIAAGRVGGPRPVVDQDRLDVHQTFVEATVGGAAGALQIRAGRQEVAIGSGRLIALREGVNVPLSFDGVRAIVRSGAWRVDAIALKPVSSSPGVFDDRSQRGTTFWGLHSNRALPSRGAALELYYFGIYKEAGQFDQGLAHEHRHTVGARISSQNRWAYDVEAMYQFGRFGVGDISAWRAVADTSYSVRGRRWQPRLEFVVDVATGDKDPADPRLESFNLLFQSGTYSGRAQLLGPINTIRIEPTVTMRPAARVGVSAGWGFFWRESVHDGLYGIPGNLIVPSHGVTARYEGSRPIVEAEWQVTRHLSAHVTFIYVFNGPFEKESVHGTPTMSFVTPWITYRF